MKKKILVILFILITVKIFAKEQIGTCNENVYKVGLIQKNIPVCLFFEEEQGLISTIKKYYIKIGDNNFGPYDSINSWLFTSDKIIYTAKQDERYGLFINGINVDFYKGISNFFISNDKQTLIYAFENETGVYIKSGQKEIGPFDGIKYFLVYDDKVISYAVKEKSKFYIYTENNKYGPFDDVSDWKYQENSYAYKVENNNKQYIYTANGLLAGPFDTLYLKCFSNDGSLLVYETIKDDKTSKSIPGIISTLWVNNKKIEEGWLISYVDFTNENEIIYSISYNNKPGIIIKYGKKEFGPFIQVRDVALSNDKKILAYAYSYDYAPNEQYYLCVGNEKAGPYEDMYHISFSPNNNTLAYIIKENNNYFLICNQKKYGPYESIFDIVFADDGKKFVYTTDKDYKDYVLHVDDFSSKSYDFITNVYFKNNVIHYSTEKDGIYYNRIILNNKEFVGNYMNEHLIYIEDGKIFIK